MLNLKSIIAFSLFTVGTLAAFAAAAGGYRPAGTSTAGPGPTTLSYAGFNVPCHSTFTVNIPVAGSGGGTITNAVFTQQAGDSSLCPNIKANNLPWTLTAPTSATTATITGVSVTVPGVVTCTGSVPISISGSAVSFNATLTPSCGVSGSGLTTPITVVYP